MSVVGPKIASPFEALAGSPRAAPETAPSKCDDRGAGTEQDHAVHEKQLARGTALLRACATGNEAEANALLDSGMTSVAQLHKSGVNALWMACHQGLDTLACRIAALGGPETFRAVHSGTRTNALFRACSNGLSRVGALLVAAVRCAARRPPRARGCVLTASSSSSAAAAASSTAAAPVAGLRTR